MIFDSDMSIQMTAEKQTQELGTESEQDSVQITRPLNSLIYL